MVAIAAYLSLSSGQNLRRVGLGTAKADDATIKAAVKSAVLDAGYRHVDCAPVYQNEKAVGEALAEIFATAGGPSRADVFVTSKLWNTQHDPRDVRAACEKTLKDLRLVYVDMFLMHWPLAFPPVDEWFPRGSNGRVRKVTVPIKDTWTAMEALVDAGLVKAIGVSNFKIEDLKDLLSYARIKPVVNQVELHPYLAENELLQFCEQHDIQMSAYSPLGCPDLHMPHAPVLLEDPVLVEIGRAVGRSPAAVALRWNLQRSTATSVLPKSVSPHRIAQNIALFDFELSAEQMAAISALDRGVRYNNHEWTNYADDPSFPEP